jgi:hypothetical protein
MFLIVLLVWAVASAQVPPAPRPNYETMTYEQFMRELSLEDRYRIFVGEMSPEKKAALMGAHYDRCLQELGSTLTPDQTDIVHQAQEALTPDVYRQPPNGAAVEKMRDVEMRAQAAFSEELGILFFTMESECKAK